MGKRSTASFSLGAPTALLVALASASAWAKPAAVVGEAEDPRGRVAASRARAALLRALKRANEIDLIPLPRVVSLAEAAGVRASALRRSSVLIRYAAQAGADAAVVPAVKRAGRELRMHVAIIDRQGSQILSKDIPLARGELTDALASRLAASVGAALTVHASDAQAQAAPPPEVSRPTADLSPAGSGSGAGAGAEPAAAALSRAAPAAPADPAPEVARRAPDEEPESSPGAARRAGPAFVALSVAYTATWRTYRICPEVPSCDQSPPLSAGASSRYTTASPYGGILVRADLFPLSGLGGFARGFGFGGGFGQSMDLTTHYTDSQGADRSFGSYQRRFWGEFGYRLTFALDGAGAGWVQARAGYLFHLFAVDANPKSVVESRRSGLYGDLAVLFPLHRYVAVDARFALVPYASPGALERAAYGASASGGGLNGTAGFSSDFGHPEWHVRAQALFEIVYFGDRYTDSSGGTLPAFARGQETYLGAVIGLQGAL